MMSEYESLPDNDGFAGGLLGTGHFPNGVYFAAYEDIEPDGQSVLIIGYNCCGVHGLDHIVDPVLKTLPSLAVRRDFVLDQADDAIKDRIGEEIAVDAVKELSRRGRSRVPKIW